MILWWAQIANAGNPFLWVFDSALKILDRENGSKMEFLTKTVLQSPDAS